MNKHEATGSLVLLVLLSVFSLSPHVEAESVWPELTPNERATAVAVGALGPGHPVYDAVTPLGNNEQKTAYSMLSGEIYALIQSVLLADSDVVRRSLSGSVTGEDDKSPSWKFGLITKLTDVQIGDDAQGSDATLDSFHLAAYVNRLMGRWTVLGGAGLTFHRVQVNRLIRFTGFTEELTSDYGAITAQIIGQIQYTVITPQRFRFEPFIQAAVVELVSEPFVEKGGHAALQATGAEAEAAFFIAGLKGSADGTWRDMTFRTQNVVGWRHTIEQSARRSVAFAGGEPFTVSATPHVATPFVEAGVDIEFGENLVTFTELVVHTYVDGLWNYEASVEVGVWF